MVNEVLDIPWEYVSNCQASKLLSESPFKLGGEVVRVEQEKFSIEIFEHMAVGPSRTWYQISI